MDNPNPEVAVPGPAPVVNPFSLIVDPQSVLDAMQRSERLQNLQRRVYRPLGQPLSTDREVEADPLDPSVDDASGIAIRQKSGSQRPR